MKAFSRAGAVSILFAVTSAAYPCAVDFRLTIEPDTGYATLTNISGMALEFDAYEIWSGAGAIHPEDSLDLDNPTSWVSIEDRVLAGRVTEVTDALGIGALSFGELISSSTFVAEGNLTDVAVLQAGASWSFGAPFAGATFEELVADMLPMGKHQPFWPSDPGLKFFYHRPDLGGEKHGAEIIVLPEPATLVLAAAGAAGLVRIRRRR